MKSKHPIHRIHFLLMGIPFLMLSPATRGQNQDNDEKANETAEAKETAEEKGKARGDKEAAKRAEEAAARARTAAERTKEAAEGAKEAAEVAETEEAAKEKGNARRANEALERTEAAAERAKVAAERAEEVAERAKEAAKNNESTAEPVKKDEKSAAPEKGDTPARGQGRREPAPGARELDERQPTPERRDRRELPATPAVPVTPATPVKPQPPADQSKPPADMPVIPSEPLKPREKMKPPANEGLSAKETTPELAPGQPAKREIVEIPASEPERQAESEVAEVTREVQRDLDQRKTRIEGREDAQALIDEILGAESRISRAEIAREERFRPRIERQRQGDERLTEVLPDQRRAATTYFQQRLRGREVDGPPPEFFRRSEHRGDRRDPRVEQRVVERVEFVRPRYLNEGRRYVHYDSRAAIPAILMAAQAMNHVRFQPTREIAPIFYGGREVSTTHAMPLPPENYRSENSLVVSYPVDENSMISSEDILFLQGSTQFSDPYSYEVVGVMADAMKAMPEEDRFVIEGHASAEGSYESNMVLSQQRAEHIVREIVRRGVSPYRLLPVGYGESEARHPTIAAEALRSQDRRVVVFRMKAEPIAKR